jgi:adenine C2-methylase RlmN of 23S rRNA A2503 and tRNA A37
MSNNKQNLLSLNQTALTKFFETLGEKPYRVKQLMQWIYKYYEFERPVRAARSLTTKEPKPVNCTPSPLDIALEIASVVAFSARAASALENNFSIYCIRF